MQPFLHSSNNRGLQYVFSMWLNFVDCMPTLLPRKIGLCCVCSVMIGIFRYLRHRRSNYTSSYFNREEIATSGVTRCGAGHGAILGLRSCVAGLV